MDLGTGLTIASAIAGVSVPVTVAMIKYGPQKESGNGNGVKNHDLVTKEVCTEKHKHADQRFDDIMAFLRRIEEKIDERN